MPRTRQKPATDEKPEDAKAPEAKKQVNMVERVRRAQRIAADRALRKPVTWETIARREGLSTRQAKRELDEYKASAAKVKDGTGAPVLEETLLLYEQAIDRLATEAEYGDNSASRVGAVRELLNALRQRIELLAVMGRMPRNFRALEEMGELAKMIRKFSELLEQHHVDPEIVQEFVEIAREAQPIIEGHAAILPLAEAS